MKPFAYELFLNKHFAPTNWQRYYRIDVDDSIEQIMEKLSWLRQNGFKFWNKIKQDWERLPDEIELEILKTIKETNK